MKPTIATQLTGTGRAAVATVAVRGSRAIELTMTRFRPANRSLTRLRRNRIHFGTWIWKQYSEELVVCRVGDDELEIHCHGGHWAAHSIQASLAEQGVEIVAACEWLQPANHDRYAREALARLPQLKTKNALRIALDQSRHAMREFLAHVRRLMVAGDMENAVDAIQQTLDYAPLGMRLGTPFDVVVMGPPNSGKSSLINALVGYHRAIVYDQPGTTRDIVSTETALEGWAIRLSDTAGIRETQDPVESAGIQLAEQSVARADLVLLVQDLSDPLRSVPAISLPEQKTLSVGTKADIAAAPIDVAIATSSIQNAGIQELGQRIVDKLIPHVPPPGAAVPLSATQQAELAELRVLAEQASVSQALEKISELLQPEVGRC